MNTGGLNSFSINSTLTDSTVRSVVDGYAYALADAVSRVTGRLLILGSARADATPTSRMLARRPVVMTGKPPRWSSPACCAEIR